MTEPSLPSNNFSSQCTNNEGLFEEPQGSKIFSIIFFSLTTLMALLGNSVILNAAREHSTKTSLPYHLVTNLSAAEIVSTLFLSFTFVYIHLDHWPFGEFACKVTMPLQVLSLFVVTSTLAAIAVYRFLLIFFQIKITVTYRKFILFISLLWLAALGVAIPLTVYFEVKPLDNGWYCCEVHFKGDRNAYEVVRLILNFGLPYLIMVVSYGAVAWKLKRRISRSTSQAVAMCELSDKTEQTQEEDDQQDMEATETLTSCRVLTDLENDLLKMIYVIVIVFAVCYLPYQMGFLFYIFQGYQRYPEVGQYKMIIDKYCLLLTCLPSAIHPLCYGTMNKFYARSFSRLVLCH